MFSNMKAVLLLRERQALTETSFVELIVWRLSQPAPGSAHDFKYSLALVADGICILRYDNEAGKGDHKHVDGREAIYHFTDLATLQVDFWKDVETWEKEP